MVCKLFGKSNLSRHVELVLAGYKSTDVSWLHAWTFFYVSIWMSWNIQITWTIYLLLIKCQSGFIGGKRPTFHLGFIQNFNLFFHQSAQFRKHTITKHIIIFVLSSWHYSVNTVDFSYDACLACLLWGNASFMVSPVAVPHRFRSVPLKVLCGKVNETWDRRWCFAS